MHLIVVTIRAQGQIADKEGCIKMHLGAIAVAVFQTASYCTSPRERQARVLYNCATISLNMDSTYKCCVTCWQLCTHKYVLFSSHNPGKEKNWFFILVSSAMSELTTTSLIKISGRPNDLTRNSRQSTSDLWVQLPKRFLSMAQILSIIPSHYHYYYFYFFVPLLCLELPSLFSTSFRWLFKIQIIPQ